jgi:hypothetical protein
MLRRRIWLFSTPVVALACAIAVGTSMLPASDAAAMAPKASHVLSIGVAHETFQECTQSCSGGVCCGQPSENGCSYYCAPSGTTWCSAEC